MRLALFIILLAPILLWSVATITDMVGLTYTPMTVTIVTKRIIAEHDETNLVMLPINGGVLPITSTDRVPSKYYLTLQDGAGKKDTVRITKPLFDVYKQYQAISYPCAYTRLTKQLICS